MELEPEGRRQPTKPRAIDGELLRVCPQRFSATRSLRYSRAEARSKMRPSSCSVWMASMMSLKRGPGESPRRMRSRPVTRGGGMSGWAANSADLARSTSLGLSLSPYVAGSVP